MATGSTWFVVTARGYGFATHSHFALSGGPSHVQVDFAYMHLSAPSHLPLASSAFAGHVAPPAPAVPPPPTPPLTPPAPPVAPPTPPVVPPVPVLPAVPPFAPPAPAPALPSFFMPLAP